MKAIIGLIAGLAVLATAVLPGPIRADVTPAASYPEMAPLVQYLMDGKAEIALARSAAPASISDKADVMVLDKTGYRTDTKGSNGFVCMVWRSWSDDLADAEFWSPKVRAPICLNPAAVASVLPGYLQRTEWVLSGLSRAEMQSRFAAAVAKGEVQLPAPGAMSYMMSKQGYLADAIGHASPHIMFFVPRADHQDWGANLPKSPIWGLDSDTDPSALFGVSVSKWSDGTPAAAHSH